jgi:hypothetical protein
MPPRKSTRKKSTKRRSTTQKGRGLVSDIHNFVKENQLISKGIRAAGHDNIANAAEQIGYGRRKKATMKVVVVKVPTKKRSTTRRKKSQTGRGIFDSLGGALGSLGHGVGKAGYGLLSGLTGGGSKRKSVLKF